MEWDIVLEIIMPTVYVFGGCAVVTIMIGVVGLSVWAIQRKFQNMRD